MLFYDKGSFIYQNKIITNNYIKKRLNFLKILNQSKSKSILDIGCGVGTDINIFSNKNLNVFGIDNNSKMIKASIKYNPKLKDNIISDNFFDYNFENMKFDSIWSISFLQVIDKVIKCNIFAEKCSSISNSNSVLFVSTPFLKNLKTNQVSRIYRKEYGMYENFMNIDYELLTSSFFKNGYKLLKHNIYKTLDKNKFHNEYLFRKD